MKLYKIGGREKTEDGELGPAHTQYVLFHGEQATDANIEEQIQQFKHQNGIGTPGELVDWINRNSVELAAKALNSPAVNHSLEYTED